MTTQQVTPPAPTFREIEPGLSFGENLHHKWYCVVHLKVDGETLQRYMHPQGWERTAYYFDSKRDAQLAHAQHGWQKITVTSDDIFWARSMREDMERDDFNRQFEEWNGDSDGSVGLD